MITNLIHLGLFSSKSIGNLFPVWYIFTYMPRRVATVVFNAVPQSCSGYDRVCTGTWFFKKKKVSDFIHARNFPLDVRGLILRVWRNIKSIPTFLDSFVLSLIAQIKKMQSCPTVMDWPLKSKPTKQPGSDQAQTAFLEDRRSTNEIIARAIGRAELQCLHIIVEHESLVFCPTRWSYCGVDVTHGAWSRKSHRYSHVP